VPLSSRASVLLLGQQAVIPANAGIQVMKIIGRQADAGSRLPPDDGIGTCSRPPAI
jgi:hypothetical protein